MPTRPLEPLWDVVEEHLDEAEFLWGVWEHSLLAPNYTLDEVAEGPEERLLAHLDGLVVGGPLVAQRLLLPALGDSEPGRASAAALALLASPEGGPAAVLAALRELPDARPALARALARCPHVRADLAALLDDADIDLVAAAADVLVFQRAPIGPVLKTLLAADDPAVRALGLRALPGEPQHDPQHRALLAALTDDEVEVVDAAIEACCVLGLPHGYARIRQRLAAGDPSCGGVLRLLALGGDPSDHAALRAALALPALRRAALASLALVGAPEDVEATLPWLEDPATARLAGEVFTVVTGVDLEDAELTRAPPEDEALDHTPEDDLPLPEPLALLRAWSQRRGQLPAGVRHLGGAPRSLAAVLAGLRGGSMRRRDALALDLRLRTRGALRLQTRALTADQRAGLAELDGLGALDVVRPLA